jgi:hypothetical protein
MIGSAPAGYSYRLIDDSSTTSILVEVTAPGDFNHDGSVDSGDYVVWRKELGTKYAAADLDSWRTHFGQTYTPGAGSALSAVPEPATWALLIAGAVLMFAVRRQVRGHCR